MSKQMRLGKAKRPRRGRSVVICLRELRTYREHYKWGFQYPNGKPVTPAVFDRIGRLEGDYILVQIAGTRAYMGSDGKFLVEERGRCSPWPVPLSRLLGLTRPKKVSSGFDRSRPFYGHEVEGGLGSGKG